MIDGLMLSAVVVCACLMLLDRQIGFTLEPGRDRGFIVSIGIPLVTRSSCTSSASRTRSARGDPCAPAVSWPGSGPAHDPLRRRRRFLAAAILYLLAIGDDVAGFTLGMSTVLDLVVVFLLPIG